MLHDGVKELGNFFVFGDIGGHGQGMGCVRARLCDGGLQGIGSATDQGHLPPFSQKRQGACFANA
jgi:hypothetical protein